MKIESGLTEEGTEEGTEGLHRGKSLLKGSTIGHKIRRWD